MMKSIAMNAIGGFFDDLRENNVLNRDELLRVGEGINFIVNRTKNLVNDLSEKTQTAGKIFVDHFFNSKKQLSLKSHPGNKDDESESTESSSSSTESEDESEETPQEAKASQPSDKLKLCPRDHFHKLKTTRADEIYPVMEKEGRTRLALIICNKEFDCLSNRYGSENDLFGMKDLLENLGYSVVVKENLTALEMEAALRQFADRQEHRFSDSTFLVFMSHGLLDGICGTKHAEQNPDILHDDTIFQIFNNRNCQSLKDKPKVIIVQACRGQGAGSAWVTDMGEASAYKCDGLLQHCIQSDAIKKTHVEKDFIAFRSSTPHNVSWRLDTDGSLFISQLIYYFKEYSWCYHLEEIFRKVQHSFEIPKVLTQMPTIERVSMTRYFYLFPGN
ncbi:hypothetical protein MC885_007810 [Smutsia gigantea]|nr:hypothetical protein MC885_007810 [Smutsia gigantea]